MTSKFVIVTADLWEDPFVALSHQRPRCQHRPGDERDGASEYDVSPVLAARHEPAASTCPPEVASACNLNGTSDEGLGKVVVGFVILCANVAAAASCSYTPPACFLSEMPRFKIARGVSCLGIPEFPLRGGF